MTRSVLVVDDSASMRMMVAHTLTQSGFQVVESHDGNDALEKLAKQKFQLVITDLNMPKLDGIGLIKAIRAKPELRFMPVLMLTTEALQQRKLEGKAAGATGWLVKPFNPEQLLQTIAKVVP